MAKTIVIVSSLVDSTIREYQVDVTFHLFKTLDELDSYIETSPLRASELFLTKEILPNVNTSLNYFAQMLENPFLKVDKITYITEVDSPEIASVNYLIEQKKYSNWEIIEGHLTREYVAGIVNGNLRNEIINPKRRAVYRVPRETFLKERLKNHDSLEEEYLDDEKQLRDIPAITQISDSIADTSRVCEIHNVVGSDCDERTAFAFLLAQYLSFSGKTLILERDVRYHRLTEFVTKSGVEDLMLVEISELLNNPTKTVERIRTSSAKLIIVGAIEYMKYNYSFILSILYNNLLSDLRFVVQELDYREAPTTEHYICAFPATVIGILSMCDSIDPITLDNAQFVGIDINQLQCLLVENSKAAKVIMEDVLERPNIPVQLIRIRSLKIGGDSTYDLRSIIETR